MFYMIKFLYVYMFSDNSCFRATRFRSIKYVDNHFRLAKDDLDGTC